MTSHAEDLNRRIRAVLSNAVAAHRDELKVYESLRNLNEVIGTEYGDRVVYELIQNAHDAHRAEDQGRIAVRLVVRSEVDGTLYVANGGGGFRRKDVDAIVNLATTAKEIGEGIGNKGLGFRSIEALTEDVRIFSRKGRSRSARFDGYCFRFANVNEIEALLRADGIDGAMAGEVAATVPRFLVPLPLAEQPDEVVSYARRGYASVIVVPLRTAQAIELARRQVQVLADLDVPLLLFLDRIAEFRIDVETPDGPVHRRRLSRRQMALGDIPSIAGCRMLEVRVGEERRFLVVQREVDKEVVLDAVRRSVSRAPQVRRWLDWQGQPTVSVAVGLSPGAVAAGRLYNFLPMGDTAVAPLLGHLDAPFFAEIDRRDADFDLPLNATLLKAAAEACVHAALHLAGQSSMQIPQRSVFDLVAWLGRHAGKLDAALDGIGSSLRDAPIVPTVVAADGARWASLSAVSVWPAGTFSLMKGLDVSRRTGARLVSAEIDRSRLDRLEAMAQRQHLDLSPSAPRLAEWSARFARSLADQNAAPRTWIRFYEDLNRVFDAAGEELGSLAGKAIFLDRSKKLRPAGSHDAGSATRVYVRSEASRRRRAKDGVPLPPATLTRRYRFLDEKIVIRRDTLNAFIKAGLVRDYDPLEALRGLGSALGANANDNRRREALTWAFSVWRSAGAGIQEALRNARLRVPTLSGWRLATQAAFSSSWRSVGVTLENFLVEASDTSPDCRRARDTLLVAFADWSAGRVGTKRQWVTFLMLLDVADGLRPVAGRLQDSGLGWSWNSLVRGGDSKEALDEDWCSEASLVSFRHPYTEYRRRGKAWRLPGQIEHGKLSESAKEAFQDLAFKHLETHKAEYLTFDVGRFARPRRDWDWRTLPTPLATFLRSKAWIAAGTHEEPGFRKTSECWTSRKRQDRPPRFLERVSDTVAGLVEGSEELADLVFGVLELREWHSPDTAPERLRALAVVAPSLATHDRQGFRREYRRAWLDLSNTDTGLPHGLDLAVSRDGRWETLVGDAETAPTVIVTENAQAFEARILSSAGHALLDIGEASAKKIAERLTATGRFTPRQLDGIGVRLLVDGESFVPRASDPLLTSVELAWLPEVVLLGHEMRAEGLERGIHRVTVERHMRAIRVRRCQTITLAVDEKDVSPQDSMEWYGVEHPKLPTLILSDRVQLTWSTLGKDLSRTVARLIDLRLRFLEPLLLRLALGQDADTLEAPGDEALAAALGCDARTLLEHRAALRTDLGHILHLLMPVVAYFADATLAQALESDAERAGAAFDLSQWLRSRLPLPEPAPQELIDACGRASDRAALRKELSLDYERFNRALLALDESPLSNEAELRSMYDAYVRRMGARILERLRRRHADDFREGRDLAVYVQRKTFAFLGFDRAWILTKETLDNEIVEAHVSRLLDQELGEDHEVDLPSSRGLVERNRKSVRDFTIGAISVVRAWCRRNRIVVPEPWGSDDPQAVTRQLENAGLLDFESVGDAQIPALCHRAACWPEGMPRTLDPASLGLDETTVEEEEKRRERERQGRLIERRSIDFAETRLDTADSSFAEVLRRLAENSMAGDDGWFERSRRPRLTDFTQSEGGGTGGAGGGTGRRKPAPEDQRQAMGLASEWLAFQYLRRRHGEAADETCWISGNRARFFGGDEGDDAAGYDFCVKTPQAEWLYEVKSSLEDACEFELTPNEMRVAAGVVRHGRRRYRILYVPFVFSPDRWLVLELPNPMGDGTRSRFKQVGHGSVRFRFEHSRVNTPRSRPSRGRLD